MRTLVTALLLASLVLAPVRGRAGPEVNQELLDALIVLATNPEVDTAALMGIVLDMFPGETIYSVLDKMWPPLAGSDAAELPAYAGATGFEDTGVVRTGFEDKPGPAFDLADHTAPLLMAALAEAARRIAILDDSDRLVEVYRAAGGISLPAPFRISPLGLRWYAAVEARDYEVMADIARQIRDRQESLGTGGMLPRGM